MSVIGWLQWSDSGSQIQVSKMPNKVFITLSISAIILSLLLGYVVDKYTDATLVYVDALTTCLAVLATWLMVKKIEQNWLIWIFADAIGIYLYTVKGHYPIAFLFIVYTIIAVFGYYNWRKILVKS